MSVDVSLRSEKRISVYCLLYCVFLFDIPLKTKLFYFAFILSDIQMREKRKFFEFIRKFFYFTFLMVMTYH